MDFTAFDTRKIDEYAAQAKATWGKTDAYREFEKKIQAYITEYYYTCTKKILRGLGEMYSGGGSMTENIDRTGGEGTAAFATKAIRVYCG